MRPLISLFILIAAATDFSNGLKILMFTPTMSRSNGVFTARVGDLLASQGHQVTLYAPKQDPSVKMEMFTKKCTVLNVPGVAEVKYNNLHDQMDRIIFEETTMTNTTQLNLFADMASLLYESCETQVSNKEVMQKLKAEKFDLAFAHMYDFCPFGMIEMLEIPTTIWICSSGVLVEQMAAAAGVTSPPSFVPSTMSDFSDRMTFKQRMLNFLGTAIFAPFIFSQMNSMTAIFRQHVRPDFPELMDLAGEKAQLLFINGIELLDFPRPILHKVIYMGGIGMKSPNPLDKQWDSRMSEGKDGTILISFGSVANPSFMPKSWKTSIIGLATRMPTYAFLWKYNDDDVKDENQFGRLPKNLHLSKWMPQTDILSDGRLKAFITHGGYNSLLESAYAGTPLVLVPLMGDQYRYNSLLESAYAGTPLVLVPLMGDQYRNGRVAERHGFGLTIQKSEFNTDTLQRQLTAVLTDKSYAQNAKQMSRMLKKRPVSSEEQVVKWTEFLAEFKSLPNLDVASRTMSSIEYHNLDVFGVLFAAAFLILMIFYKTLRFCLALCCGSQKSKNKSKKSKRE